jgi:hypothetical protein
MALKLEYSLVRKMVAMKVLQMGVRLADLLGC